MLSIGGELSPKSYFKLQKLANNAKTCCFYEKCPLVIKNPEPELLQKLEVVQRSRHFDQCFVRLSFPKRVNIPHLESDKVEVRTSKNVVGCGTV